MWKCKIWQKTAETSAFTVKAIGLLCSSALYNVQVVQMVLMCVNGIRFSSLKSKMNMSFSSNKGISCFCTCNNVSHATFRIRIRNILLIPLPRWKFCVINYTLKKMERHPIQFPVGPVLLPNFKGINFGGLRWTRWGNASLVMTRGVTKWLTHKTIRNTKQYNNTK